MKIYYLDDEEALCDIFKELFSDNYTTVETFIDAGNAISRCETAPPDIIFIDYRLTDTSGDKVAAALDSSIVKVLVTGELEVPNNTLFFDVVSKPYKLSKLKEIVDTLKESTSINPKKGISEQ